MTVDPRRTAHRSVVDGRAFTFCGPGCKARFDADPEAYLDPDRRRDPALAHAGHH
jgi:Cu+-exporting ATPase